MARDVVYSESELCVAKNVLLSYADYLARQMEAFNKELGNIQGKVIDDKLICAGISNLSFRVKPLAKNVYETVNRDVCQVVDNAMSEVSKAADAFKYPASLLDTISSLLAAFL